MRWIGIDPRGKIWKFESFRVLSLDLESQQWNKAEGKLILRWEPTWVLPFRLLLAKSNESCLNVWMATTCHSLRWYTLPFTIVILKSLFLWETGFSSKTTIIKYYELYKCNFYITCYYIVVRYEKLTIFIKKISYKLESDEWNFI
jgi:hypothetical protein